MKKLFKILALAIAVALVFCSCSNKTFSTSKNDDSSPAGNYSSAGENNIDADNSGDSVSDSNGSLVKFTMENGGSFVVELYPQYAPETVNNFKKLVSAGFYDGLTFHRVVDGFMAQGGSSDGLGYEGSSETITGEFALNGFSQNTLSHSRGVISMARSSEYDSASSQFFICYDDASFLDGSYAAFGKVIEGMEVVDGFLEVERRYNSSGELASPVDPIIIEKAEVI